MASKGFPTIFPSFRGQAGLEDSNGSKEVAALKDVLHNPAPWREGDGYRTTLLLEMVIDRLFFGVPKVVRGERHILFSKMSGQDLKGARA